MLRRAPLSLALSLLLFAPACKKDSEVTDEAKADEAAAKSAVATRTDEPATPPTEASAPAPTEPGEAAAGGSGGSGGSGGAGSGGGSGVGGSGGVPTIPREDLTCDPLEAGDCLQGEQCIGPQGCDAVWTCDATIICKKDVREYCGCDGRTFETVMGNCPWQKYQYPGPCK
jgi:hypothetical protein